MDTTETRIDFSLLLKSSQLKIQPESVTETRKTDNEEN